MKIYVIEKLEGYEDGEWTVDNRCYTSRESAEKAAREMSVVAYVHSLDLVDELQEYAEQLRGDTVNHPEHYTNGDIECIDAIRAALTAEQYAGYLRGNIIKYLWRYDRKGGVEDLRKARTYLEWLIEAVDE